MPSAIEHQAITDAWNALPLVSIGHAGFCRLVTELRENILNLLAIPAGTPLHKVQRDPAVIQWCADMRHVAHDMAGIRRNGGLDAADSAFCRAMYALMERTLAHLPGCEHLEREPATAGTGASILQPRRH